MSPFVSIVDKAVVQRAAGTHSVLQSGLESVTTIIRKPFAYVKSPTFLMMWTVYAATYTTGKAPTFGHCERIPSFAKINLFQQTVRKLFLSMK